MEEVFSNLVYVNKPSNQVVTCDLEGKILDVKDFEFIFDLKKIDFNGNLRFVAKQPNSIILLNGKLNSLVSVKSHQNKSWHLFKPYYGKIPLLVLDASDTTHMVGNIVIPSNKIQLFDHKGLKYGEESGLGDAPDLILSLSHFTLDSKEYLFVGGWDYSRLFSPDLRNKLDILHPHNSHPVDASDVVGRVYALTKRSAHMDKGYDADFLKVYDSSLEQIAQKSMLELGFRDEKVCSVKCVDFADTSYLLFGLRNEGMVTCSHDFKKVAEIDKTVFWKVAKAKIKGEEYLFVPSKSGIKILDKDMNAKAVLEASYLLACPYTISLDGKDYLVGTTKNGQASLYEPHFNSSEGISKDNVLTFGNENQPYTEGVWDMCSVPTKRGDLLAVEYISKEGISLYKVKGKNAERVLAVTGGDMNFI